MRTALIALASRLRALFSLRRLDEEARRECEAHIELLTERNIRAGMRPDEARSAARRQFGNVTLLREDLHRMNGFERLDSLAQDVRYAIRGLWRSRGFAAVAVLMLAVGIGVNAAMFSVANAVLFKGFPSVVRSDRILYVDSDRGSCVSDPDFQDWRHQARSFVGMAGVADQVIALADGNGSPERADATRTTANAFSVLGTQPILGRDFTSDDERPGAAPVAILTYRLWQRRYGGDPAIVGRTLRLDGTPTTVIGVMPRGFTFPQNQDLWVPLVRTPEMRKRDTCSLWFAFGRLTDGASVESARAEMKTIGARLASAYPLTNGSVHARVQTFNEFYLGPNSGVVYLAMLGAVAFVLLIACANVAVLLLARSIGRTRELSVRLALGAGRWRIVRQLVIESVLLSSSAGLLGWMVAAYGVRAYARVANPPSWAWFDHVLDYAMDYRVFAYLTAVSIGTGLLFGLAPMSRLSAIDLHATLKDGGRSATSSGATRASAALVTAEVALAVVLLTGAGLMVRSFLNVYTANIGVSLAHLQTAFIALPAPRYPERQSQLAFFDRLEARLRTIPGVESVALTSNLPGAGGRRFQYDLAGAAVDPRSRPRLWALLVSPGYFRTLETAVVSGRDFTDADGGLGGPVIIVNQLFANASWPGQDPLGKRLRVVDGGTPGPWLTVVGVAPNIMQTDATRQTFGPVVYLPLREQPSGAAWVLARSQLPPGSFAATFHREVQAIDPDLPVWLDALPVSERLAGQYWSRELNGALFLIFAAVALLLASIGLYAVIAHTVVRRTQEIGVRMAIGATAGDILKLVFAQGAYPLSLGLALGLAASFGINRVLESELIRVSPSDPATYLIAAAALIASATLGCLIPARRATRVDPVVALRHE